MLPPALRERIEAVSAAQSDGSRRLIEGVNRQWQEQQNYYNGRYSLDSLSDRLEKAQTKALEAREETNDDE